MRLKLIFGGLLALVALIFVVQNVAMVQVRFLFWSLSLPRSLLMLILLAIGLIVGWLVHGYAGYRKRRASDNG